MAWKVLEANLSGLAVDAPSMLMDANGYPNCAWTNGSVLKFVRFKGNSWEYLGDSIIYESSAPISLSKNCIATDTLGNPHIFMREEDDLKHIWWDGVAWQDEDVLVDQPSLLDWCPIFDVDSYLVTLSSDGPSGSNTRMYKKIGVSWVNQATRAMPAQEQDNPQIIARKTGDSIYVFWRNQSGSNAWIAHLIYRINTSSWFWFDNRTVQKSLVVGEITGLDFVPKDGASVNPNDISSVDTTFFTSLPVVFSSYLSVNINGSTTTDNFIRLFSGTTSGLPYDATNFFWGDTTNISPKTSDGYISLNINGTKLYLPKYKGSPSVGSCSNLVGTESSTGLFVFEGYALLHVNYDKLLYTPVYRKGV